MKLIFAAIVLVSVVSDQMTKIATSRSLELYEQIAVLPMFNITLAHNYGAAFSFLNIPGGAQRWMFTGISAVVSIALIVWLWRLNRDEKWLGIALALVLGGAIGNLIDRAMQGYVVDFIQVYYKDWYFPSFNIADSAIFCGTVLLLGLTLFDKTADTPTDKPA
ncbi:MAG: signal peptidase II [Granulosicoccaceae bacterium]